MFLGQRNKTCFNDMVVNKDIQIIFISKMKNIFPLLRITSNPQINIDFCVKAILRSSDVLNFK